MAFLNQHSFLLISLLAIGALAFFLLRDGARSSDWMALASLALGFLLAYSLLQPGPGTARQAEEAFGRIGNGQPVLLEFQSPYCLGCMVARPLVDQIEREQEGRLVVVRLNVTDPAGRAAADRFGLSATPSFLFFDPEGTEVWRSIGLVDPALVQRSLAVP